MRGSRTATAVLGRKKAVITASAFNAALSRPAAAAIFVLISAKEALKRLSTCEMQL